uniref:Uncharacterized protein n=2 Tax=Physcomitrium patens TaxID=3218 RepID=A0A7I3Z1F8_PHYPA
MKKTPRMIFGGNKRDPHPRQQYGWRIPCPPTFIRTRRRWNPPSPSTPIGSPASSPAMNCSLSVPIGEPFATPPPPPPFTPWPAPSNPARPVPYPLGYDRTLHPPRPVSAFTPGQAPQVLKILISIIN